MAEQGTRRDAGGRLVADIERMCRGGDEGPEIAEFSDPAALLVAGGLCPPPMGRIVVRRLQAGRIFPSAGGFHTVRVIEEQRIEARALLEQGPGSVLRLALRTRLAELDRRYTTLRTAFLRGPGVFPTKVKEVRAERRAGLHLDPTERGVLFDALASTPTMQPVPPVPRTYAELGAAAAARGQRDLGRMPLPGALQSVVGAVPAMPSARPGRRPMPEMYTALLMEGGALYDRLQRAYRTAGPAVDEVRLQFDAESELLGLATDVCRLRAAAGSSGARAPEEPFSVRTGLGVELDRIWVEILERAVAFRELVESVESRAEAVVAEERRLDRIAYEQGLRPPSLPRPPSPTDVATDQLMHGAGDRMLSTESMRRLRGQLDPGA